MKRILLLFSLLLLIPFWGLAVEGSSVKDSIPVWDSLVKRYKVNNNPLALSYARRALYNAEKNHSDYQRINAYIFLGHAFYWSSKDSSFIYFSKAAKISNQDEFRKERVVILMNLALLYKAAQDLKTSIMYLDSAISLAETTQNYAMMADAYNNLGNIKASGMQDKENARAMYDSSFRTAEKHMLYRQMGVALGNLAKFDSNTRLSLKKNREAIGFLKKERGTDAEIAGILINIGNRFTDKPDSALVYFKKALDLGKKNNLFDVMMGAYNGMAYSFIDKNEINMAEEAILAAIPIAEKEKNSDWLSTLYDTYADILSSKGDYKSAAQFQKKALTERITSIKKQSSGQLRLLAALLDTKNKEILIQNKENEILVQTNRLQSTRLWLVIAVILIVLGLFVFYWYQQRSRMRLKNEQVASAKRIIEMEESEKGRIARELHDITGQLVMGITSEIENLEIPSSKLKGEIQDKIKSLGKSIRQISHRMNRAMMEHFSFEELLSGQCEDVQKITGIPIFLTLPEKPVELPRDTVLHIYRMFQELLTNASKYVKEGEVYIKISADPSVLKISYSDTGPGMDLSNIKTMGMGLMNIHERAKLLGGDAQMESSPGNGFNWEITIPFLNQKVLV